MSLSILRSNLLAGITRRVLSSSNPPPIEPDPFSCCDEGCESCVWLVYANELMDYYRQKYPDVGKNVEMIKAEIMEKIESPSVRAYVATELAISAKRIKELEMVKRKK